jgi:uncharacterized protein with NRDE domain
VRFPEPAKDGHGEWSSLVETAAHRNTHGKDREISEKTVGFGAPLPSPAVCLLVVAFGLDPEAPLVVGANRDERLSRPATAMTILQASGPRILGGRDEEAGGTWLAVNEHGLVAGLTNQPVPDGRDPSKRSRGELPLVLARHRSAESAVEAFVSEVRPSDYNPAWILVGDRTSLHYVAISNGERPRARALDPGIHILENSSLGSPSPKVDHVLRLLGPVPDGGGADLSEDLRRVLADHSVPGEPGPGEPGRGEPGRGEPGTGGRPAQTLAACVHTENYGTRSATLVRVPADATGPPEVAYADGPPCTSPFVDATGLWSS